MNFDKTVSFIPSGCDSKEEKDFGTHDNSHPVVVDCVEEMTASSSYDCNKN